MSVDKLLRRIWSDIGGSILSTEFVLLAVVVVLGLLSGLTAMRDAAISELSDIAMALEELDQSFTISSTSNDQTATAGSGFVDETGQARAFSDWFTFTEPIDEGDLVTPPTGGEDPKEVIFSGVSSLDNLAFGGANSASGTLGDGTVETNFSVSTSGNASLLGTSNNNIAFRESANADGRIQVDFDDPLDNVEFWVTNLTNANAFDDENLLGNFTVTLSDGTVINNASFSVIPDAITPNSSFGEFSTFGSDRELLTTVTRNGADYVTDPTVNGSGNQAAGRIVFDVPTDPEACIGIESVSFERSGGPNNFRAFFSVSGQAFTEN